MKANGYNNCYTWWQAVETITTAYTCPLEVCIVFFNLCASQLVCSHPYSMLICYIKGLSPHAGVQPLHSVSNTMLHQDGPCVTMFGHMYTETSDW